MDYENLENDVRGRIKQLQTEKGLTENGLAAGNTPAQKRLNRQLSHGAGITLDTLLRILEACPDISADWLLRGSGEMSINGNHNVTGTGHATVTAPHGLSEDFVRDLLAEKDRQINALLGMLAK